ncbi:hypothetical protein ACEWY4_017328 [Coilia grayii]|uniref:Ig-like domain-containing protein n=1 Tax=Coilia grayii TaxID=363190 RepID=A0ABD1JGJ1_9TELE
MFIHVHTTGLQVDSSPGGAAVKEGGQVTLTCKTTCNLTSSPSFIWSKDGRPVEKKQITNNQLQLHPFSREDEGNYTCAVRGHEKLPSPPFRLNVHCKKVVVSDKDKGKEGDNVTLTCNIINCPEGGSTSFIWSKDGHPVEKKQSTNNQLQLHPVSREDEGNYTCAVRGHDDLPSPPFRLNVHCLHTVQTDKDKVKEGDIVTLTCNTTCPLGGSTSFTWSKDGHPVEPVEKKKQITNNQLQLHSVSREDEGSYTCAVTGYDASSEPFVLKVKESHSHTLLIAVLALVVFCVLVGLLCIICRWRQPKASATENSRAQRKVDQGGDEVQRRAARPCHAEATGGAEADVQYSTIQPHCSRGTTGGQEEDEDADNDDVQYASIQFKKDKKRRPEVQKEVGMMLSTPASSPDISDRLQELRGMTSSTPVSTSRKEKLYSVEGLVGGRAVVRCPYPRGYGRAQKYLCRGDCSPLLSKDLPVQTAAGQTWADTGRVSLHDNTTARVFTVTITGLTAKDSGKYWCGVQMPWHTPDLYTELWLRVVPGKKRVVPGKKRVVPGKKRVVPGKKCVVPGKKCVVPGKKRVVSGKKRVVPGKKCVVPGKKRVVPGKKRVVPGKKCVVPGKKRVVPGKKRVVPGKKRVVPGKKCVVPGKKRVVPGKKRVLPGKKRVVPGKKRVVPGKKCVIPGKKRVVPGKKCVVPVSLVTQSPGVVTETFTFTIQVILPESTAAGAVTWAVLGLMAGLLVLLGILIHLRRRHKGTGQTTAYQSMGPPSTELTNESPYVLDAVYQSMAPLAKETNSRQRAPPSGEDADVNEYMTMQDCRRSPELCICP